MALYKHQMEERLRVSEEHYRTLFEGVPVGLYQQTSGGRLLAANPALVEMLGFPDLETLLQAEASEFYVNAEDRMHWRDILEEQDVLRNFEVQMRRYDKRSIWVLENTRAVRDDEGALLYYEGSLEDITSRKWAEDALRQRTRELDWLNSAGQKFSSTLELDRVLGIVIEEIRQLLEASAASIWLLDLDTNELTYPQHTAVVKQDTTLPPKSGVAGWVARRGQSLIVPDVWEMEQDSIERDVVEEQDTTEPSVRSILSVPLRARDRVIGVIQLLSIDVNHFSYAELALVEALAASAGIAIENARLYKDMDRLFNLTQSALDQTESLYHVSRAMSSLRNLEDLLRVVVDGVAEALPADQVLLVTFDRKAREIQQVVLGGAEALVEDFASFDELSENAIGWVMREAKPIISSQEQPASKDDPAAKNLPPDIWFPGALEIGSMLVIPLVYHEEVFGVLAAFNRPGQPNFTQRDLELLSAMSNHVATAIENARLVESLREQRDFAESLIETAQAIILLLDNEGRIVRFNPYMEELSGYRLEEVRGQDWFTTFLPKRDQMRIRELFLRSIDGAQTQGSINCILTKDGKERYIEWYDKTLEDEQGDVVGLLAIGHDITERLRVKDALQDSEARYRTISELTSDYAYAFRVAPDGSLEPEWVTDAFVPITGYTLEEAQQPDLWRKLVHPDDQAAAQERMQCLFEGQVDTQEFRIVTKESEVRWLLDRARPIWDEVQERVVRIIGAAQDITEQKRSALALERKVEQLESLNQASYAVVTSLQLDEVLREVMALAKQVSEAEYARVVLVEDTQFENDQPMSAVTRVVQLDSNVPILREHIREHGFTRWIIGSHQPVVVDDIAADGTVSPVPPEGAPTKANPVDIAAGVRSVAGLPLVFERGLEGVLYLYGTRPQLFENRLPLLMTFANHIALAIARARLHSEVKQQARKLAVLLEAAHAFSSTLDYDEVMKEVALRLSQVTKVTHCTFLRWDAEAELGGADGTVIVWMNWAFEDVSLGPKRKQPQEGVEQKTTGARPDTVYAVAELPIFRRVLESQRPCVLRVDDDALVEAERDYLRVFNTDVMLVLPLALADRMIGFVQLFDAKVEKAGEPPPFNSEQVGIAEVLANQAAVAIENVHLYEAVRQQRQQLRTLAARLSEAEEAERQWLAQELHDQVGQNLTALGVSLNIIRTLLTGTADTDHPADTGHPAEVVTEDIDVVRTRLDDAIGILERITERVRGVMADLRSPVLEDYGLVAALRWYGALFTERTGIKVFVEGEDPKPRLVVSAENALFRIVQEALTNVAKHAEASRVWITLQLEPLANHGWHTIRLVITDDGVGFDPARLEQTERRQGLGLVSMAERAQTIGGKCRVEPAPEGGTRVVVEVKL